MMNRRKIELLAPAKNLIIGKEAILHGADAVYIGAPKFGARAAAANTIEDIAQLTTFAHTYGAKVYVALNTVLYDDELKEAEEMIHLLYREGGVDALIVQDMGITQLSLPPIPLHASTQTDNCTPEKVAFLEKSNFSQIVLARELSLAQIATIARQCTVPLEVFVHGALCVSYSGRCYISQALCGRSANRGECAQYCRLPYSLYNSHGGLMSKDKHLLSLKDLNQSDYLEQLLDVGVSSLKIEGRLKDVEYVKNITSHYRRRLDDLFLRRDEFVKASSGEVEISFTPDPVKSFNRGFTHYFLMGRGNEPVFSPDTPKSKGEFIGLAGKVKGKGIEVNGKIPLHNGDGLCFTDEKGVFSGFRVNKAENNVIYPHEPIRIKPTTPLYRNYDHEFAKLLARDTAVRTIPVTISLWETPSGFALMFEDAEGHRAALSFEATKEEARRDQTEQIKQQLSKLGGTPFSARFIEIKTEGQRFIPAATINEWRRKVAEELVKVRLMTYQRGCRERQTPIVPYPQTTLDYTANITNHQAERFYKDRGVASPEWGFEKSPPPASPLMYTKHCLRYAHGLCPKQTKSSNPVEPLFLRFKEKEVRLEFDCKNCIMLIKEK